MNFKFWNSLNIILVFTIFFSSNVKCILIPEIFWINCMNRLQRWPGLSLFLFFPTLAGPQKTERPAERTWLCFIVFSLDFLQALRDMKISSVTRPWCPQGPGEQGHSQLSSPFKKPLRQWYCRSDPGWLMWHCIGAGTAYSVKIWLLRGNRR